MKLSEILTPELYAQVKAQIDAHNAGEADKTKHVRFADLSEGNYVSVEKYNAQIEARDNQITGLNEQITQRDADITSLNEKLTAAQADASKLGEAQTTLADLQTKYQNDKKAWEESTAKQQRSFAVREKAGTLKFTSAAAKRDFLNAANAKDFKLEGETLTGYDDFLNGYKAENPDAFVVEKPAEPAPAPAPADNGGKKNPVIVLPGNSGTQPKGKSLSELMKAKNENPDMIVSFDKK